MLLLVEPRRFGASKYVPEAMLCEQISRRSEIALGKYAAARSRVSIYTVWRNI